MAANPFLGDGLRPDQQKWASTGMGAMSPMWLPFIAAASAGAAWWAMTHWARVMGSGYPGVVARGPGSDGSTSAGAAQGASSPNGAAPSAAPSAQPLDAVSARSTQVAAPQDAPVANDIGSKAEALAAGLESGDAGDALTESLAVQGEDASADPVMPKAPPEVSASAPEPAGEQSTSSARVHDAQPSKPAAPAVAPQAAAPAPEAKPAQPAVTFSASGSGDQPASATDNDDHPAPTLPPHEGLPARRKGGKKKN